jgi:hypothetical protein
MDYENTQLELGTGNSSLPLIMTADVKRTLDIIRPWLCADTRQPFLLVGPQGCGKRYVAVCNKYLGFILGWLETNLVRNFSSFPFPSPSSHVCVCVCVCEREREREITRNGLQNPYQNPSLNEPSQHQHIK